MVDVILLVLSIVNWLHLMATVTWIGGIATNILVILPSTREVLEQPLAGKLMGSVMKRFRIIVYISIVVLVISGILMNLFNKSYLGVTQLGNLWTQVILVKHIFVVALIVLAVYAFEVLAPKVSRLAVKGPSQELVRLQKLQLNLALLGFALGIIILFLTGIATAISATS
jgi:uncharacterized membrane protein